MLKCVKIVFFVCFFVFCGDDVDVFDVVVLSGFVCIDCVV